MDGRIHGSALVCPRAKHNRVRRVGKYDIHVFPGMSQAFAARLHMLISTFVPELPCGYVSVSFCRR
jgi:hypothetical protein